MRTRIFARRVSRSAVSASLPLVLAALVVLAVGMHSLVQAQRVAQPDNGVTNLAGEIDPTTYLSVVAPTMIITLTASPTSIHVSGNTSLLEAKVTNLLLSPVPDGTEVFFQTSLGSVGSAGITKTTVAGVATATLTSGPLAGTALITATADGAHDYALVEFIWYRIALPLLARNY